MTVRKYFFIKLIDNTTRMTKIEKKKNTIIHPYRDGRDTRKKLWMSLSEGTSGRTQPCVSKYAVLGMRM
jgi:hypothetical protein